MNRIGIAALIGYALTVPAANYSIAHWGITFGPNSPHLIEVFPSVYAPSGVLWIGCALAPEGVC